MTTTPITDQPNLRTEAYKGDDTKRLIVIPLAQNLIAGVAIAVLACIVLYPFGVLTMQTGAAALAGGLAVACAVTVFRFFADDFGLLGWAHRGGAASRQAEIDAIIAEYEADIEEVRDELRAEQERHRATKRERDEFDLQIRAYNATGKYVAPESTEDPIRMDAERLIDEWARRSYEPPTQRLMAGIGWTPQRYTKALTYLGSKGIVDRNGTKPRWMVDTKPDAVARLEID